MCERAPSATHWPGITEPITLCLVSSLRSPSAGDDRGAPRQRQERARRLAVLDLAARGPASPTRPTDRSPRPPPESPCAWRTEDPAGSTVLAARAPCAWDSGLPCLGRPPAPRAHPLSGLAAARHTTHAAPPFLPGAAPRRPPASLHATACTISFPGLASQSPLRLSGRGGGAEEPGYA